MAGGSPDAAALDGSIPAAVVSLDCRFASVNQAFADVLGLAPDLLVRLGPLAVTHPADRDRVVAMLGLMRAGSIGKTKFRHRWLPLGEEPVEALVEGSVIQSEDGAPVAFSFTLEALSPVNRRGEQVERSMGAGRRDGLTGLPDLMMFAERIERVLAGPGRPSVSVLVLGVDPERRGPRAGGRADAGHAGRSRRVELLSAVAHRLESELGDDGFVARLGDRSFGILLATCDELTIAARTRCLLRTVSQPFGAFGPEREVHATVGVAIGEPGDVARELIDAADRARRRARELGSDRFELCDLGNRSAGAPAQELADEIRDALRRDELRLRYQPVYGLSDRSICGVEVLLRWEHPSRTVLPPDVFLPAARRTGEMVAIGRWVLEESLRQLESWNGELARAEPLRLFVNLSAPELADASLLDSVEAALDRAAIRPEQLAVEVSDAALIDGRGQAWRSVAGLRELGALILVDQFGTAFSSLSDLERLPVDMVKLDRSCVAGIADDARDRAIAHAAVAVAEANDLTVLACGVETERQADALVALGCHLAQGFLFAEPRAARAMTKLLRWNESRAGRQAS